MEPSPRNPDGLGWLRQVTDEMGDRRERYLELTEDGLEVAATLVEAMRQAH